MRSGGGGVRVTPHPNTDRTEEGTKKSVVWCGSWAAEGRRLRR